MKKQIVLTIDVDDYIADLWQQAIDDGATTAQLTPEMFEELCEYVTYSFEALLSECEFVDGNIDGFLQTNNLYIPYAERTRQ